MRRFFWIKNKFLKEFLSEMFGTTMLVVFSCASVAQYKLALKNKLFNENTLSINVTVGLALTVSIFVTAKSSGIHFLS
jgi:glycerol uptake facilitator-like aquaporin